MRYEDGRSYTKNGWFFENGELVLFCDVWNIDSRAGALKAGVPARVLDLYESEAGGKSYGRSEKDCDLFDWFLKNIG